MAGFLFGGDTGVSSAAELARKREIVNALLDPSMTMPQTFGEGLTVFGRAIAGKLKDKKLAKHEDAERARVAGQFDAVTGALMGGQGGGSTPGAQARAAAPRAPAARDPLAPISIAGDTMVALGKDAGTEGYRASLIGTESGGDWGAANNETGAGGKRGHFGRVQFGHARLQEAMDAGAIPQGTTPEQFMASPALQIAAENWHFGDLESKLGDLVGTTVNGQPMDMAALVAMGHLGGAGGARKFVESGGAYNPSDSFGTSLADYAATHGGKGGSGAPVTMSASGPGMADVAQLSELAANPYLPEGQRAVVNALMAQAMTPPDPMAAIEMERAQLELEALRNPSAKPVDFDTFTGPDGTVYRFNPATGVAEPITGAEAPAPVKPYSDIGQINADLAAGLITPEDALTAKGALAKGRGTSVTVENNMPGVGPELGKLSTDYAYVLDPDTRDVKIDPATGLPVSAPVPGSPAAQGAAAAEEKRNRTQSQGQLKLGTTLESINLNLSEIEDGGLPVTGAVGDFRRTAVGRALTGNDAVDFDNRTRQITDSAAFAEIQNMRDNSPTGGAVGQLTDQERQAIGNAVTALNSSTSSEEYARAAKAYRELALNLAFGEGMWEIGKDGSVRAKGGATASGAPAPDVPPPPEGIDPADWQFMTPEERALFQ